MSEKKLPPTLASPIDDMLRYYFLEVDDTCPAGFYVDDPAIVWFLRHQSCHISINTSVNEKWFLYPCYRGSIRWNGSIYCLFEVVARMDLK